MGNKSNFYDESKLTERQKREIEYYGTYVNLQNIENVSFDPIDGRERRPWNSYWYVYELSKKFYNNERNKLLDFGCGCGESSVLFAKIGYDVHGFDISQDSIDVAKKLSKKYGFENKIDFSLQVSENLDFKSNSFDIIVGVDILHHVELKSAINECKRVLKKGGIAIFREPVEVPFLDYIRNTRLIKYFVPNEKNYTPGVHITQDERKLCDKDISILSDSFKEIQEERFTLLARFDRYFRKYYKGRPSPLEIIDYLIFKYISFSKKFGGDAVFILKNPK